MAGKWTSGSYTLPETNIAMENPPFWWYLPGKIGIFMGYVSFGEGSFCKKDKVMFVIDIVHFKDF